MTGDNLLIIGISSPMSKRFDGFSRMLREVSSTHLLIDAFYPPAGQSVQVPRFLCLQRFVALNGRCISSSELGCLVSHRTAVERFLCSSFDVALILEDDVLLNSSVFQKICRLTDSVITNSNGSMDILSLNVSYANVRSRDRTIHDGYPVYRCYDICTSAAAYVITKEGARKYLSAFPFHGCADWPFFLHRFRFYCSPVVDLSNISLDSTIEAARTEKFFRGVYDLSVCPWECGTPIANNRVHISIRLWSLLYFFVRRVLLRVFFSDFISIKKNEIIT